MRVTRLAAVAAMAALVSACEFTVRDDSQANPANEAATQQQQQQQAQLAQIREQAAREFQQLRFLVDVSDRQLRVLNGEQVIHAHDVSVGTREWPTPTGSWEIHRVDLNPEWIPPKDEEWAKDEERKAPGAADNPMGRARLVYRMPNTIHGTNELSSLGKAASHGSIRVANDVVIQLAELLLKAGGAWEGPQWFQQMAQNQSREFQIDLPRPVPIVVQD